MRNGCLRGHDVPETASSESGPACGAGSPSRGFNTTADGSLPASASAASSPANSVSDLLSRPVARPHLLEVVEIANLGTEDVNDDVAVVDQHPIAGLEPFHANGGGAFFLELALELVSDGTHVPVGAPRGDHHVVADCRLAREID